MASLLPGFEYDIFISYRQKDNKRDRWVSEFVKALKSELEATFKEDITIYFDENPHDGLLETHDVDASLKEKLKCLIFIPIISRTYCDPKSFAWDHEFKAFIEQASNDQYGLKIKLPNGNVASRVLPVRIYDLDVADIKICESVLGGAIRGVDFVFKEPGVNRPLTTEDDEMTNQAGTKYRNQINKTANAIKEIIAGLRPERVGISGTKTLLREPWEEIETGDKRKERVSTKMLGRRSIRRLVMLLLLTLCVVGALAIYKFLNPANSSRTIAFIPLRTFNNDITLIDDGDNFIESINDKLNAINSFIVIPRISTLQYRNTEEGSDIIRKKLKANYLLDGSIRREDNKLTIWIELTAAKEKKALWSNKYIWDKNKISQISQKIVRDIAVSLDVKLTPEDIKLIETEPSKNPDANLNYISANVKSNDAWFYYNYGNKLMDSSSFNIAVKTYDKAIEYDSVFALAYARRAIATSWGYYVKQLDSTHIEKCKEDIDKALALDSNLNDARIALGFYYYYCKNDFENAIVNFKIAAENDPGNYQPLFYQAIVYRKMGKWKESQNLISRVIRFDPKEALFLTNIGLSYTYLHNYDSALIFHQKAIDIMPGWPSPYINYINSLLLKTGKTAEARIVLDTAISKTGEKLNEYKILLDIYEKKYGDALKTAEKSNPADFYIKANRYLYLALINNNLNNPEVARKYYDSARVSLNNDLISDPDNNEFFRAIGIAYAGLGNKLKAIEAGEKAVELKANSFMDESDMKINLAQIYAMVGEYDTALSIIEYLLINPSGLSVKLLQLDPVWKPLSNNPKFKSMLKRYSRK